MNRLILASYKDNRTNKQYKELFRNDYQFNSTFDTFNDLDFENRKVLVFKIQGKTYNEKQSSLKQLAIEYQEMLTESCDIDLSINELSIIYNWLEQKAQLFGLTKEFKENAII